MSAPPVNIAKTRIYNGQVAIGFQVRFSSSPEIARIAASCGYHWLFIDMEHNSLSINAAAQICVAALDAGVSPIVRVPGHERFHVQRILDNGAMGVWCPHIDTAEQARAFVDSALYPPKGSRGSTGASPLLRYTNMPALEANKLSNNSILTIVQLESAEAIENAYEIAAVEGVDVLSVGTGDLTLEQGVPNDFYSSVVMPAYERVVDAARKNGKRWRFGGVYDPEFQKRQMAMGTSMPVAGSDLSFMLAAARDRASYLETLASELAP